MNGQRELLIVKEPKTDDTILESYVWSFAKRMWEPKEEKKPRSKRMNYVYSPNQMPADAGIYAERLFSILAHVAAQDVGPDAIAKKVTVTPSETFRDHLDIVMPADVLLPENSKTKNLETLKNVLQSMQSVVFRFDDKKNGITSFRNLIYDADVSNKMVHFSVSPMIWRKLMDYSEGSLRSEYWVAKQLSTPRAYIMYKLVRNLNEETAFTPERIMQRLNLPVRYKYASELERYVLNPIRQQLDQSAPWSFEYRSEVKKIPNEKGRGAPRKQVMYLIKPIYRAENDRTFNKALEKKTVEQKIFSLDTAILNFLLSLGFKDNEIASISSIVSDCYEAVGIAQFFTFCFDPKFRELWEKSDDKKAYLVDAIKRWTKDAKEKKKGETA